MFESFIESDNKIIDTSWVKWVHFAIPDEENAIREKIRLRLFIFRHCLRCTALSGCYFLRSKKPIGETYKGLLHDYCDCYLVRISKPSYEVDAFCNIKKFTDYIFSKKYSNNGKAILFNKLGFEKKDSDYLKFEYEKQARLKYLNGEYKIGSIDEYGQNISIEINLNSATKENIVFVSGWKVHPLANRNR